MKIVLNKCFGGFGVSERLQKILGAETPYFDIDRTNPILVEEVEKANALNQPELASDRLAHLVVVEIPDTATDYTIVEYDGLEKIFFVVDGKIFRA